MHHIPGGTRQYAYPGGTRLAAGTASTTAGAVHRFEVELEPTSDVSMGAA